MRDIERYQNNYLDDYDFEKYMVQYRLKNILETLSHHPHNRILEIGCGMEPVFKYLDANEYEEYVVVEPGQQFFEYASELASAEKKVSVLNDYFENCFFPLKEKSFDYIICSSLLHELESPEQFLQMIMRVCNKDTIVYINVPNAKSFHRVLAMESGIIPSIYEMSDRNKTMQQTSVFDMESLTQAIKNVDSTISILETGSYFIKPFSHKQMADCLYHEIIDEKVLDGLDNIIHLFPDAGAEIFCAFKF